MRDAIAQGAPSFTLGLIDARPGISGLLRIFQVAIGLRTVDRHRLSDAYAAWGRRFDLG